MKTSFIAHSIGITALMVLAKGPAALQAQEIGATGLKPPTTEERAWMEANMEKTRAVRFNSLGKARSDAAVAAQNLPPLPPMAIVPVGQESQSDPKASGAIVSTDTPAPVVGATDVGTAGLPAAVDNSTLACFPEVRNQGSIGSCASFSTTYYVGTHMTGLLRGWSNNNTSDLQKFSPKWTYAMVNGGADSGSWFTPTFDVLIKLGAATWNDWPYSGTNTPSSYLEWCRTSATWRNAVGYRFNTSGVVQNINTQAGLDAAKALLNNGYLLLYGTNIYGWANTTLGNDPATTADNGIAGQQVASMVKINSSGHAMTIVGYNDEAWTDVNKNGVVDSGEKGAFKIVNSWGNGWPLTTASANTGFAWMSYDALRTTSAVTGGDNTNRANGTQTAFWNNEVYWITARTSYTPTLLGEFTLNHAKRNQMKIKLGRSATNTTTPTTYFPTPMSSTPRVFENLGGAYALDGTSTAVAGTFVFDFTDIVLSGAQRYYLEIADNAAGSAATVSSFRLLSPTGSVLATATAGIPLSADGATSRAYVDFSFGSTPAITSAATASGRVAQAFTYNITATNSPTSYSATNLPPGLTLNSATGAISGTPTTAGTFTVALGASNATGTGTGNVVVTIQPALVSAPVINSATTASATVGQAFTYQITATNTPTSFGATSLPSGITVNTATGLLSGTPTQSGTFTVALSATNGGGTGTRSLTITVAAAPVSAPVVTSPATAAGTSGSSFTYRIEATNSPTSFGATGLPSGLTVNTTTGFVTGTLPVAQVYSIVVSASNAGGTGYKNLALTVTGDSSFGPANNAFSNRLPMSGSSASTTGSNVNATAESGEPAHAGYAAAASVWWTWTAPANGPVTIKTVGSSFDTVLAVYTGSVLGSLTPVASDDDSGGNRTSLASFTGVAGTVYNIAVDGYAGATGTVALTIQQTGSTGPANDSFSNAVVVSGSTVAVTGTNQGATAQSGEPALAGFAATRSVWWSWTAPGAGQAVFDTIGSNFDTLLAVYTGSAVNALTVVASDDQSGGNNTSRVSFVTTAGTTYRIAVDGYLGAAGNISLNLLLTPLGPVNDNFVNRTNIAGSTATVSGSNVNATVETGEPFHFGRTPLKSVWWKWTAPSSGEVTLSTIGSPFDTILAVYTGSSVTGLTSVAADDDSGGSSTSRVVFQAVTNTTYSFAVDSYSSSSQGAITLNLSLVSTATNDNFASRAQLTGTNLTTSAVSTNATAETGEPTHAGVTAAKSLWWKWTAPQSGNLVIDTSGSSFDTVLEIYTGTALNNLASKVSDDDGGDGLTSRVSFNVTAGTQYAIAVDGFGGASGTIALALTFTPSSDLYFTNFEAFTEGSNQLSANDGWIVSDNTLGITGIFQGFPGTHTAWIGYNPPSPTSGFEYAYLPLNYDPVASGTPVIRFSTRMQIVDSTNSHYDNFAFALYNIPQDLLCNIDFNNANLHVYRYDGQAYTDTGVTFANSQDYVLSVTMNFQTNQWSATLQASTSATPVTLFTNQPMNTTGKTLNLGDIDPSWIIGTIGSPGNNYMVFDDYRISIGTASAPLITSSLTRSGMVGQPFSYSILATNSPTSYNATGMPGGLSVNTNSGLISGTPTAAGTFNVTISALNASGADTKTLVLSIASPPPVITSATTGSGSVGQAFSYTITASGGAASYGASGLPPGLLVNAVSGLISGTPSASGLFNVTLSATNSSGTGSANLALTILPQVAVITSSSTASAIAGSPFTYTITATGRVDSYTASPLPGWLSVNSISGVLSGTPPSAGVVVVNLGAVNQGGTGAKVLTITVTSNATSPPSLNSPQTASASTGVPFNYSIQATGNPTSFGASGLPSGVTINTTSGAISGTPTVSGVFNVVLSATNGIGTGTRNLTLTVQGVSSFVKRTLPKAYSSGGTFQVSLEAKPTPGQAWAIEEALPPGWTASAISDSGSFSSGKVRLGPYTTSATKVLTYSVAVPASYTQAGIFAGVGSSGGVSSPITGRTQITRADSHPADTNGDNKLTIDEVTQYATAWQGGQHWQNEQDEIPMDYAVRGSALWKAGETYVYDSNVTDGPAWYVSTAPGAPLAVSATQNVGALGQGTSSCTMPVLYAAGTSFTVQITVTPTTGVLSYGVEDQVPVGWAVSAMSDGGQFDSDTNKVKWGPFNDSPAIVRILSYKITPPAGATGVRAFVGVASFDGIDTPIGGTRRVSTNSTFPAIITSPAPSSALQSQSVTLNWDSGVGASGYTLWVGSTASGYDLYSGYEGTNLSRTLTLPTDGRVLYVTLHSLIGGVYQNTSCTFTAYRASGVAKAQLISPFNGTPLTSTSLTLSWNAGVGVTSYYLYVGTYAGGYDVYYGSQGTNLSKTLTVPADRKIYVTLYSLIAGAYQGSYYVFNPVAPSKATLVSPADGSTLAGNQLNLSWSAGTGVSGYLVWVGSSYGGYDLGAVDAGTATARTITVPQDGGPIYVTLWSLINGGYQANNYWFNTALPVSGNRQARITSPVNAGTQGSATMNLTWDAGIGVTSYALWVGSTPNGYDLYSGLEGTNLSKSVPIPGDGRRVHVTLHSLIGGSYQSNTYWFTAPTLPDDGAAQVTSPANGSTLTSSSLSLTWSAAAGATQYYLMVGNSPGASDYYSGSQGTALARTVTGLPLHGPPVYVTLYSMINGAWKQSSAWFKASNSGTGNRRALITTPANDTTLPSAATTLNWGGGVGMTSYALWIGSSPGGYDLWSSTETVSTTSRAVTLPTDGRKLYVTLYSFLYGAWQGASYIYTAASNPTTKAAIYSPANGGILTSSSQTFNWSASNVATTYALWIGRYPGGYDIYAGAEGLNLSRTVTTLPTDGSPVYVTLYSLINGAWQSNEYIYQSGGPP